MTTLLETVNFQQKFKKHFETITGKHTMEEYLTAKTNKSSGTFLQKLLL